MGSTADCNGAIPVVEWRIIHSHTEMTDSFEDLFLQSHDPGSPGGQLYLYRQLRLRAASRTGNPAAPVLNYKHARQLAVRLAINTPDKLAAFFSHAGLGSLNLEINEALIMATLTPETIPAAPDNRDCELERGFLDGALELITGVPVTTRETGCWSRGNGRCTFEASRDVSGGQSRYIAVAAPGVNFANSGLAPGFGSENPRLNAWYMDLAAREVSRSSRHNRPLAVIYLDIDDLGAVNAKHGRGAGDQLISAIAAAISKECRTEDHLWHPGEDEFVILLPETGETHAEMVAQRLIENISGAAGHLDLDISASASIGLAIYPAHGDSLDALLASAKSALYLAKSLGKGRAQLARVDEAAGKAAGNLARHPGRKRPVREAGVERAIQTAEGGAGRGRPGAPSAGGTLPGTDIDPVADAGTTVEMTAGKAESAVSVLLAVTSPLLGAGIKNVLAVSPTLRIVEEATGAQSSQMAIMDLRPDLIITDLAAAAEAGFAIPKIIREENLPCKLAVFAGEVDQEVLKLAAEYAPEGILLQNSTPEEILKTLDAIYTGKSIYPEGVHSALSELEDNRRLLEELSDREIDVLKLVAEGKSNSQISDELYITVNTVRFHLANVYQKLGVGNRTEAANYYLRQDLSPETQPKLL